MKLFKHILIGGLVGLAAWAQPTPLPELKKPFEAGVRAAQQQGREQLRTASARYLAALAAAEQVLQESHNAQGLAWVLAERQRFEQAGTIPEEALGRGPLRRAQEAWQEQAGQAQAEQARRLSELAGKYIQELARLQQELGDNPEGLAEVKAETDRVLDNSIIRAALQAAKPAKPAPETAPAAGATKPAATAATAPPKVSPGPAGAYKFFPPGKEPPAKELKPLRLEFPNMASRSAASAYGLGAGVFADKDKLEGNRQGGAGFAFKQERGVSHTTARLTVTSHGRELAEGSRLAVHYFSRPVNSPADCHEERVELITLPALARGQAVVVDGAGIDLGKFEHHGTRKSFKGGDEFYGLIVSLFSPDGKMLIQQCSSSALAKACPSRLPEEKQQESLRERYGGGKP